LRSPDPSRALRASFRPLLAKELWQIAGGRALWTMLLLLCPLVGYSFVQAVSLYGEASGAASQSPALASGLSPLDGVLVPTFGAFYVAVTLLFPFVAIRVLGHEKETGALRLLVQLPYRTSTLIAAKLAAILAAWLIAAVPVFSALAVWQVLGGHLDAPETLDLLFGHLLYGLLVGAIALFAASISESAATAAILTLAFTIGSWVLDFTAAGRPGLFDWLSRLSLTQTLRPFEQGLLSAGLVAGMLAAVAGFAALAAVWLHPGVPARMKLARSLIAIVVAAAVLGISAQLRASLDVAADRRNSFPAADERALHELRAPLTVTVHLAPEDPRYADLRRNVLAKLERTLPNVTVRLAGGRQSVVGMSGEESYGVVDYDYGGRPASSRSTSHREVLPLLYGLAGVPPPAPGSGEDYPGYPLAAEADASLAWFLCGLPLLIAAVWWWSRRPPRLRLTAQQDGDQP
jgi:ABC-2 type transport system permease protein